MHSFSCRPPPEIAVKAAILPLDFPENARIPYSRLDLAAMADDGIILHQSLDIHCRKCTDLFQMEVCESASEPLALVEHAFRYDKSVNIYFILYKFTL